MTANPAAALTAADPTARFFTVEQANRALVYVRRIVRDVQRAYRDALAVQHEVGAEAETSPEIADRYEALMSRLAELHEELQAVGVELRDYELGLVDFPAVHEDREIWLCWQLGEPAVCAWHEQGDGFAGRQPIEPHTPASQ